MKGCPKSAANPLIETIGKTVAYQKDNIVSREVIRAKGGTVTLFAFDAGQGLSEHTAPLDALVQVLDGTVEIRIEGKPYRLKAGQMMVMPEGRPHALKALTRFMMMLTMIKA